MWAQQMLVEIIDNGDFLPIHKPIPLYEITGQMCTNLAPHWPPCCFLLFIILFVMTSNVTHQKKTKTERQTCVLAMVKQPIVKFKMGLKTCLCSLILASCWYIYIFTVFARRGKKFARPAACFVQYLRCITVTHICQACLQQLWPEEATVRPADDFRCDCVRHNLTKWPLGPSRSSQDSILIRACASRSVSMP